MMKPKALPAILQDGITVSELKALFGKTDSDVKKLLLSAGVRSVGLRDNRYPLYHLRDAAKALVAPDLDSHEEILEHLVRMSPEDLPPKLTKAFWDAKTARQTFEKRAGDLWDTARVVEVASETFKAIRLSLLLIPDTLLREAELTERQRSVVQRMIDSTLNEIRTGLEHAFKDRRDNPISEPESSGENEEDYAHDL